MKSSPKMPYEVYASAFHGGRLISRHRSLAAAQRARKKWVGNTGCLCGCAGIIDRSAGQRPGTRSDQDRYSDPYAIGSI